MPRDITRYEVDRDMRLIAAVERWAAASERLAAAVEQINDTLSRGDTFRIRPERKDETR